MRAAEQIDTPPRRTNPRRRVLIAGGMLLGGGLIGVWLARVPIATGFIDRELAANRVTATYDIADLGFGRQRLTNVVIGDPARPDLVADWIETQVDVGAGGPRLAGVRAGRVRMRGRLIGGRLSLGAIDRLLPAPSGAPFALPAIELALGDARMRIETPAGVIGARLSGRGRLDDGFRGMLALAGDRIAAGGCSLVAPRAVLKLAVRRAAPTIAGPVRAASAACSGMRAEVPAITLDMALGPALDRWSGQARAASARIVAGTTSIAGARVATTFAGDARRTEGKATVSSGAVAAMGTTARAAGFDGTWRFGAGRAVAAGRVRANGVALAPAQRRMLARAAAIGAGTPIGPLVAQGAQALARAAAGFDAVGELGFGTTQGRPLATIRQLVLSTPGGARATLGEGAGIAIGDPAGVLIDGVATLAGGGLPSVHATLNQPAAGAPVTGIATIAPYAAGGARLALAPVRFTAGDDGATRITTVADLSGSLGDGRVDALRMPLEARWDGRGGIVVNPGCAPLRFARLTIAGLALRPARLTLCPVDRALVTLDGGRIGGGARIATMKLAGTLGGAPATLAAAPAEIRPAGFVVDDLAVRIGTPDRVTQLDAGRIGGRFAGRAISGDFADASGRIGNVPLLLSGAAGNWRFGDGALSLTGALTVADAAPEARFLPLAGRDVTLRLRDGVIDATGKLNEPTKGVKVAAVTIRHTLASGVGSAHLDVPGIAFGEGFQPEELTRLTFGVIADVKGVVRGAGDIAWAPDGVTSTGNFATDGVDLAAAFGPVTGIKGSIAFTDLLALESAPGQVATVASINPGVPVNDGRIVYRTLPGSRVAVEGGRWPFAGGTLTLEPTLLDFTAQQARRMTFRVDGMEAAQFLQQFEFKNLDATGVFDGVLPMTFDDAGGRIENGRLTVRDGGGSLAYVGDLTEKDLGTWGNIAFQALKSLRYRNLDVVMNGPLAGEMITEVRFAGVSQGQGAKSNFLIRRLQRLPFVFNIRIKAPFRGLLDSAASFYDPKRLIERNLPALLEEQSKRAVPPPVQPPASEILP